MVLAGLVGEGTDFIPWKPALKTLARVLGTRFAGTLLFK